MENHRIKVKLGDAEFDAEGKPEVVQAQYEAWLALVSSLPKAPAEPAAPLGAAAAPVGGQSPPPGSEAPSGVPFTIMDRVFRQGDVLSLAARPRGDSADEDAMLAILYGYLKLKNLSTVTGTLLMKSAKVSGVPIGRVDRTMNGLASYVLAAGVKKAKRYQLNNPGISRAEEIIKAILQ